VFVWSNFCRGREKETEASSLGDSNFAKFLLNVKGGSAQATYVFRTLLVKRPSMGCVV